MVSAKKLYTVDEDSQIKTRLFNPYKYHKQRYHQLNLTEQLKEQTNHVLKWQICVAHSHFDLEKPSGVTY